MAELTGMRIAVAGAGVFGLSVALRAVWAGAAVEVWDPAVSADNASGVAAGMIAPVGEVLFDRAAPAPFAFLRAGRDAWSGLRTMAPDLKIDPCGAVFCFPTEDAAQAALNLARDVGADISIVEQGAAGFQLRTPEDWRIDPAAAIEAMRGAVVHNGGAFSLRRLSADRFSDFDAVVIAAGIESRGFSDTAPELLTLEPIKGQMARIAAPDLRRPMLRTPDLYLAPQAKHVLAGATMEPGRADRNVVPEVIADLRARAVRLMPKLEDCDYSGVAGVRASTPDGLPLAGPSSRPGVYLATGARRNGWLLAPLVSEILVSYLSGGDGGPYAALLDPRRFSAPDD